MTNIQETIKNGLYREWGSYVGGVYHTQNTPLLVTARVKQEEKADTRIIERK